MPCSSPMSLVKKSLQGRASAIWIDRADRIDGRQIVAGEARVEDWEVPRKIHGHVVCLLLCAIGRCNRRKITEMACMSCRGAAIEEITVAREARSQWKVGYPLLGIGFS